MNRFCSYIWDRITDILVNCLKRTVLMRLLLLKTSLVILQPSYLLWVFHISSGIRGSTNVWYPGMCICPPILLCSSSLAHLSILSLQLPTLLTEVGLVCECVWPLSLGLKSPPGWHLLGLSEGIWSGACCQSGPCITFKEVSVSPSPYHSCSTAPPARLVEAPLGISGTLALICVSSKSIRPF